MGFEMYRWMISCDFEMGASKRGRAGKGRSVATASAPASAAHVVSATSGTGVDLRLAICSKTEVSAVMEIPLPWLLEGGFITHASPLLSLMASKNARRSEGKDMVKVQGMMSEDGSNQSSVILQASVEARLQGVCTSAAAAAAAADDDDDDGLLGVTVESSDRGC